MSAFLNPFSSDQFSHSVVSDSLRPHGLQHTRLPCPSPTPGACSNSCLVMPSNHLILYCPLLLLPSIFPSIRESLNTFRTLLIYQCSKCRYFWLPCFLNILKYDKKYHHSDLKCRVINLILVDYLVHLWNHLR